MPEAPTEYSFTNIHFPQRITLIKQLRHASFLINDIVLIGSLIILFASLTDVQAVKDFLFQKLAINQFSPIPFMLLGASLFFGAKRHIPNKNEPDEMQYPWWNTVLPLLFASTVVLLGFISIVQVDGMGIFRIITLPPIAGLCFFLLGLSLIPPFTQIPHRFHVTQLLVFLVSGVSMYVVLDDIFQMISLQYTQSVVFLPFSLGLTLAFFCFGVLLRWSNRGFFGNFTLDSTGSRFAFRIFLLNLITAPLVAFIAFVSFHTNSYRMEQILSVIVVLFAFLSSLLIWINVKLLYPYELEHLLMRESLHSHNIDLTKEEETLRQKMTEIEQEKQQYADKLNTENALQTAADASSE